MDTWIYGRKKRKDGIFNAAVYSDLKSLCSVQWK